MNDSLAGSIEALAWVLKLLEKRRDSAKLKVEVELARDDLLRRTGTDFRERIKT